MTSPTPSLPFVPRPWGGLASFVDLHREMNRAFDNLFFNGSALLTSPFSLAQAASSTLMDVQDDENGVRVTVDMPGIRPTDLDVHVDGDMLTLSGRREKPVASRPGPDGQAVVRFESAVRLPFPPKPEEVRAELKNGVLTVQVPREATLQHSHRIEVTAVPDGARPSLGVSDAQQGEATSAQGNGAANRRQDGEQPSGPQAAGASQEEAANRDNGQAKVPDEALSATAGSRRARTAEGPR